MGAVFVLPVMFDLGIHFGFGDCSFTHPLPNPQEVRHPPRQKQPQSKTINCNAKYL